jgi:hypothetical protein
MSLEFFVSIKNKDCDPFGIFSSLIGVRGPGTPGDGEGTLGIRTD